MPSTTVTKTTSILPSGQWIYASAVAESTAYSMSLNYNVAVSTGSIYAMMLKPEDYSTFKESTDDVPKSFLFLDTITPSAVQTGRFTSALEPGTYTMLFYCPFAARVNCTSVSANAFWTFLPGTPTNWGGSAAITGGSAPTGSGSGNPSVGSSASGDLSVGAIVGIAIGGIAVLAAIFAAIFITILRRKSRASKAKSSTIPPPSQQPPSSGTMNNSATYQPFANSVPPGTFSSSGVMPDGTHIYTAAPPMPVYAAGPIYAGPGVAAYYQQPQPMGYGGNYEFLPAPGSVGTTNYEGQQHSDRGQNSAQLYGDSAGLHDSIPATTQSVESPKAQGVVLLRD